MEKCRGVALSVWFWPFRAASRREPTASQPLRCLPHYELGTQRKKPSLHGRPSGSCSTIHLFLVSNRLLASMVSYCIQHPNPQYHALRFSTPSLVLLDLNLVLLHLNPEILPHNFLLLPRSLRIKHEPHRALLQPRPRLRRCSGWTLRCGLAFTRQWIPRANRGAGGFGIFSSIGSFDAVGDGLFLGAVCVPRIFICGRFLVECDADGNESFYGVALANGGMGSVMGI